MIIIAVTDMKELPRTHWMCNYYRKLDIGMGGKCALRGVRIAEAHNERPDWCPLIGVDQESECGQLVVAHRSKTDLNSDEYEEDDEPF